VHPVLAIASAAPAKRTEMRISTGPPYHDPA
jgi:hypothetical protein